MAPTNEMHPCPYCGKPLQNVILHDEQDGCIKVLAEAWRCEDCDAVEQRAPHDVWDTLARMAG